MSKKKKAFFFQSNIGPFTCTFYCPANKNCFKSTVV